MTVFETMRFPEHIRYNPFNRPNPFANIVIQSAPATYAVNLSTT